MANPEFLKDVHDRETKQGKYHPDYDKYPTPSWKLKAGESARPWIDDYKPRKKTHMVLAPTVGGPSDSTPVIADPPNPQKYAQDKANARRTSLSTNDSARG